MLDITEWIEWFLNCLQHSIAASEQTLEAVLVKAGFWKAHAGVSINDRQRKTSEGGPVTGTGCVSRLVAGWRLVVWLVFCSLFAKLQKKEVKPRKHKFTNKNGPEA